VKHKTWTMVLAAVWVAGSAVMALAQDAKDSTAAGIAQYREMLADGNPAELWEAAGEELWKKPAGPKQASLEACDLGLGPGVVKGAYAKLPRFFKDTGRVMDAEQRLMHCRMTLQGLTKEEASARPFSSPGKASDIERLMAYVASESRGTAIDIPRVRTRPPHVLLPWRRV
jgi:L-cysteine S-thiosulfotransferase